jgi:prepilin signal peptidase PulO-like enzyme (type II secretory pathway)
MDRGGGRFSLYVFVVLWWLFFLTAFGLSLGSFLNVIIYRIPRDQSLSRPVWSFCPHCGHRIRWYDNLPVISFIRLGGRCRDCGAPISTRYVIIELLTALLVLMLFDAFVIAQAREGLSSSTFGVGSRLAYDWPIFLAHVILFAALLSMSAIDLEHYWVDVRFTNIAIVAGFVLHALWTPRQSFEWHRPSDTTAVVSFLVLGGLAFVWIMAVCRPEVDPEDFGEKRDSLADEDDLDLLPSNKPMTLPVTDGARWGAWLLGLIVLGLIVSLFLVEMDRPNTWIKVDFAPPIPHALRALVPLAFIFLLIIRQSWVVRESDREIVQMIEEERSGARRMVANELAVLLPVVAFGALGWWLMNSGGEAAERISNVLHSQMRLGDLRAMRTWQPLYGIATAASGYVIAGAIGWAVRIAFTLLFGREAFGVGDIHMMAATGCVAGWPVVLLGFMLSSLLALAGWLATLPKKNTRAIPLGPWLSVSFLAVVVFYERIVELGFVKRVIEAADLLFVGTAPPM